LLVAVTGIEPATFGV